MTALGQNPGLEAVIFDVDGTLVDSERDGHRVAFNQAFEELGLPDHWDIEPYGRLLAITGGTRRLHSYLADRGMPEAERNEVVPRLHARKTELFRQLVTEGRISARPGVERLVDELTGAGVRLAVATTGTRSWVEPLLDRLFGRDRFEVVVTGEDTPERKPDPGSYLRALDRLALPATAAMAVEDSRPGLLAAVAADLACVIVANEYTRDDDFHEADLVLDGFGETSSPASVVQDPSAVAPPGALDLASLRRVVDHRCRAADL